ncbi:MAG TPA: TetR/AcrR family transcriptional regulator [Kouleothrix sp.]|uniref:TetR family transcriptional regulator C-terminal domain-containing protein n=1 Tax=Kouleothrix sp. TaxID=2779161 RepID=UPI002BEBD32C|nr:TetR/AcrR family transcriptional regulator [Kouleothrix sp.]HRC77852.1 TetR/AcrR family transcriptional regulator [Kouleothrix sp.]
MSKGEQTREMIVARAAPLFNRQGYAGASMADIMRATGLEKGGIYNHFASKNDLALAAFDYSIGLVKQRFARALDGKRHAIDRLHAIIAVFREMIDDPIVPGGCPVMNTAIEADDTHPELSAHARLAMSDWFAMTRRVVAKGVERGELRAGAEPEAVATLMISTLEGAIMLSRLYGDPAHIHRAIAHLEWYIDSALKA